MPHTQRFPAALHPTGSSHPYFPQSQSVSSAPGAFGGGVDLRQRERGPALLATDRGRSLAGKGRCTVGLSAVSSKTLSLCPVSSGNMLAVHFDKPGGPENLYLKEVAKPSPGEGEVLLKVAASALNRADILQVPRGQAEVGWGRARFQGPRNDLGYCL